MYINLSGLNVVVTGASRGIGRAIAMRLGEAGATIAVHYHKSANEAEELAHILGNGSCAFQADFSHSDKIKSFYEKVLQELGSIEVLINNAGVMLPSPFESPDQDWLKAWGHVLAVNLSASTLLCKKAITYWLKKKSPGRIISLGAVTAFTGEQITYLSHTISKAGIIALTRSIAKSYGKHKIRSFAILPGRVHTDIGDALLKGEMKQAPPERSFDRLTEPRDIAPMITFLCSGFADHASGATIDMGAAQYFNA